MRFAFALLAASLVAAAPAILDSTNTVPQLLPAKPLILNPDEVLLYGVNDTFRVVKKHKYLALLKSSDILLKDDADLEVKGSEELSPIEARTIEAPGQKCKNRPVLYHADYTLDYSDWDVQMSPVIRGPGTLSISRGKSIANAITHSAGVNLGNPVKGFVATFGINYQQTWTTIDTTVIVLHVPKNVWGTIVHNPQAHRKIGTVYFRCGERGKLQRAQFTATNYFSQQFGNMSWVKGAFSLCTSSNSGAIPFCQGHGTHY